MSELTIPELSKAITSTLESFPGMQSETSSKGVHLMAYRTHEGLPIGHEHDHGTMQGIWVRRDSVRLDRLKHIDHRLKTELQLAQAHAMAKRGAIAISKPSKASTTTP
ncbi:MAG: hypothetical protein JKP95_02440 [Oceanicaulis sp.]|nr:hypothetical protein [Oceanicaulis sp.]